MLNRTQHTLRYVNGFSIGSKHQKHAFYAPIPFLYRVPRRFGPGPTLMKYWWTLGCLPNGVEVPFRLGEFHQTYIREHVPAELEEWLQAVVVNPADNISRGMAEFLQKLQGAPVPRREVFQRSQLVAEAKQIHAPLQRVFDEFNIEIPVIAVRAAASSRAVKEDLLDAGFAYREAVAVYGSTPHRRWAALHSPAFDAEFENDDGLLLEASASGRFLPSESGTLASGANSGAAELAASNLPLRQQQQQQQQQPTERELFIARTISSVVNVPTDDDPAAAPDERLAVKVLTTLAEGCHRGTQRPTGSSNAGVQLLEAALRFAQNDPDVMGATHTNLASAHTARGDFDQAQFHAREGLLAARKESSSNPRAQATLAVATALRDDIDTALEIAAAALQDSPTSAVLQQVHQQIARAATGRIGVKELSREKRFQLQSQCERAMLSRGGRYFDDDVNDARAHDGTLVDGRMHRGEAKLGHASAFSGWMGAKNHTNTEEQR